MTEPWEAIAEEFYGNYHTAAPKILCEEIAKLREELSLSEKYGRTADDVEIINNLCSKLQSSRAANARLRAVLEFMIEATCTLHDHPEGQKRCREALASGDGKKNLKR